MLEEDLIHLSQEVIKILEIFLYIPGYISQLLQQLHNLLNSLNISGHYILR